MLNLNEIRARCESATPGPWETGGDVLGHFGIYQRIYKGLVRIARANSDVTANNRNNAEFIAHAREDIPALIAEIERLKARERTDEDGATGRDCERVEPAAAD